MVRPLGLYQLSSDVSQKTVEDVGVRDQGQHQGDGAKSEDDHSEDRVAGVKDGNVFVEA